MVRQEAFKTSAFEVKRGICQQFPWVPYVLPLRPLALCEASFPKCLSILSHFPLPSGAACQGCSAFEVPLASREAQRASNTSPHVLPGHYFSTAFMRKARAHTIDHCSCLNLHHLLQCCGPHASNLLNVGCIVGYSSPHTWNHFFSFSIMALATQF